VTRLEKEIFYNLKKTCEFKLRTPPNFVRLLILKLYSIFSFRLDIFGGKAVAHHFFLNWYIVLIRAVDFRFGLRS
jgi:hypothetical protein